MENAIETFDSTGRRVLDVSPLPDSREDSREPVWWGNALLICIESMTVVLLLVSYFYVRQNFKEWPPPQSNTPNGLFRPVPDLLIPTIELILIVGSCIPMYLTDCALLRDDEKKVRLGLALMTAVSFIAVALRFMELRVSHLKFSWDDNAYGSVIWAILGVHLTYLLAAAIEFAVMLAWILRHKLDRKHGLDVTLAGGYWYWTAATWILCYATVYIGARV